MADDQNQNETKLQLRILNAESLKDIRFLGKMKTFAVAWINPRFKKSTKTLTTSTTNPNYNHNLSFSLSLQTLQNPNSCITIQILSPSSPIQRERVLGTAVMSLAEVRFDEEVFTLQLWRASGRAHGLLRVSARVDCDLRFGSPLVGCVTGIPVQGNSSASSFDHMYSMQTGYTGVVPSAPDEADLVELSPFLESHSVPSASVESNPEPNLAQSISSLADSGSSHAVALGADRRDDSNVLRSLLVGLVGGAVAVATVLVGSNAA